MALGLHEAPHDPKRAEEVTIGVCGQAWDDSVVGPFEGPHTVGMLLVQNEIVAPVLEDKATTLWNYPCTRISIQ